MTPDPLNDEVLSRLEISRRELVRRLVAGTAFAVPVIASFDMAALTASSADALTPNQLGAPATTPPTSAPSITSGPKATFETGRPGSFDVTATGEPTPSITGNGSLPVGVTLVDGGSGSATLAGTPQSESGGIYDVGVIAANGTPPDASQAFTLTVDEPPAITSPATAIFTVGNAGRASVVAVGFPTPVVGRTGTLPDGLSFSSDHADGTAVISGTPAPGTEGAHELSIHASNGISPVASQKLSVEVHPPPPAKPSNRFTVTDVRVAKDGAVQFELTVPGPGAAEVVEKTGNGKAFARKQLLVAHPGSLQVHVAPAPSARKLVHAGLALTLSVTYTPHGGTARTIRLAGFQVP